MPIVQGRHSEPKRAITQGMKEKELCKPECKEEGSFPSRRSLCFIKFGYHLVMRFGSKRIENYDIKNQ
jgi:hypothetical protein